MKKTAIALAIAGLAAATVAQAAPQENTFYAGARVGWSAMHHGLKRVAAAATDVTATGYNRNAATYGVFGGYQILNQNNFGLAAEAGYDFFGKTTLRAASKDAGYHAAHGFSLALKPSYEVYPDLDVYGKAGVAIVRNMYKNVDVDKGGVAKFNKTKASLILGAGVEYAILPELAARIEYQWLSKAGNLDKALDKAGVENGEYNYNPDIHSVTAGLSYRFGQGAAPVAAEVVNKTFTLNSDVTFAFGKSTLKPEASTALDGIYSEIAQVANPAVAVNGYADRIGKDASNLKLSQRRAETVANYLVSKGVDANAVTATGYGEANPVTGATCDAVKGRKALIACLAPDRRVEVQVQGNKQATM